MTKHDIGAEKMDREQTVPISIRLANSPEPYWRRDWVLAAIEEEKRLHIPSEDAWDVFEFINERLEKKFAEGGDEVS